MGGDLISKGCLERATRLLTKYHSCTPKVCGSTWCDQQEILCLTKKRRGSKYLKKSFLSLTKN